MQSKDSFGFSPTGYWSGGHWPREMGYLAMGIHNSGETEEARNILFRALMSGKGNDFYEVLNPFTGEPTTGSKKMAYDIMDVVAFLVIDGKIDWA